MLENAELSKKYGDDSPLFLKKLAEAEEGREDQIYAGVKLLIANFKGKEDQRRGDSAQRVDCLHVF